MSVDPNPQTFPFSIENAFTDRIEGGNPAVNVCVPSLTALPDTTLQTIATNFNQPITAFTASRETNASDPSGTATLGIRWFGPLRQARLCGHGTFAAAAAVFRSAKGAQGLTAIQFEARTGKYLVARQVEDGCVEIDLDAGHAEALVGAEEARMREVLERVFGKDVHVKYTGRGMAHLDKYALIEVDTYDLKGIKVDAEALVSFPQLVSYGGHDVDRLGPVGQPVTCARRRRDIVSPGCSFRVENVCAFYRIPREPCVLHRAHVVAVLDVHEGTVLDDQCEAG
jgi:predicted PhzF superfamily epimerase YddE/YHI9